MSAAFTGATVNAISATRNIGVYCAEIDCRVAAHEHVVQLKICEVCGTSFVRREQSRQRDCWRCIERTIATGWPSKELCAETLLLV